MKRPPPEDGSFAKGCMWGLLIVTCLWIMTYFVFRSW
jgi:hypothetical protein